MASQNGLLPVVSALLAHGADVNQAMTDGATPLHYACSRGHDLVADTLITRGADPDSVWRGRTPMELAKQGGHAKCVAVLQACFDRAAKL